ncbi:MAG TPA: glycosyltransferase family 2 protein [Gammaproteobacteria bacterium]|nr:glycosyltransferase family 2 protein [Gammaproteobacteria bacterium]
MSFEKSSTDFSIVIVNWNSGDDLGRCLDCLREQRCPPHQVIVVDNNSSDGSLDKALDRNTDLPLVIDRQNRNLGFAAANNLAVTKHVNSAWVALLNPDAFAETDWLQELAIAIENYPEVGFFGSCLLDAQRQDHYDGTGDEYHVSGLAWRRDHGRALVNGQRTAGEVFAVCAAAAVYRTDAWRQVGGFDETFFCYFEDVDLAFRLQLAGYRGRYVPSSKVLHIGSASSERVSGFSLYHGHRNMVWTYFKDMPAGVMLLTLLPHLLINLLSVFWYCSQGHCRTIYRAKWDAMKGLPGVLSRRRQVQQQTVRTWSLLPMMSIALLRNRR